MNIDACYRLGHVVKTHGLKGQLRVQLITDHPQEYANLKSVFIETGRKLVPFVIEKINLQKNVAIIKFEGINSVEDASKLKSTRIFLPISSLPEKSSIDFYYERVEGFTVIDTINGTLGKIREIVKNPGQDLLLMEYEKKEVMIPFVDELVVSIDRKKREIRVNLPKGLLEIYLK